MNVHFIPRTRAFLYHEACEAYPRISEKEYIALKEDIAIHGLRDPIVIWRDENDPDGPTDKLLDGRHRFEAVAEKNNIVVNHHTGSKLW